MQDTSRKMINLFLRQSYHDSWKFYKESLKKTDFICWDYIVLTASNEEQAKIFRKQLEIRIQQSFLPSKIHYVVIPDPDGKRVGSGGATFQVLKYIAEREKKEGNPFANLRILVIHSGGDSKRIPQYSAIGKLFAPVSRELPDGRGSTLFDEIIIAMSTIPSRLQEGLMVLSGDVLLLFNPFQIDFQFKGAAAISLKEDVSTGKEHGVFLKDQKGFVKKFLHKQTEETLREQGAVDKQGLVDLDTGIIVMDSDLTGALFSLISNNWKIAEDKYVRFVNEEVRLSFYGDFLFPLAKNATLEEYFQENAEGTINPKLLLCRKEIWEVLHSFELRLLFVSPAEFIHFGTTREMWELVTRNIQAYEFLDWKNQILSTSNNKEYACHNAFISEKAEIRKNVYIEDCYVLGTSVIDENSIISNIKLYNQSIPSKVVLHGLYLKNGKIVVRIYGIEDNPKGVVEENTSFLGIGLKDFLFQNNLKVSDLWENQEHSLWTADLYPLCKSQDEGIYYALLLYRMTRGKATPTEVEVWKKTKRTSLFFSFNETDIKKSFQYRSELVNKILSRNFVRMLENGCYYVDALKVFGDKGVTKNLFDILIEMAKTAEFYTKIRIYYALFCLMKNQELKLGEMNYIELEELCFGNIRKTIYSETEKYLKKIDVCKIKKDKVIVNLPLRINWGGGWTDASPYCNEQGGTVLNAAVKLNGDFPVKVILRKLPEYHIQFEDRYQESVDVFKNVKDIQKCNNPYDIFALHKAALLATGVIPLEETINLETILKNMGGGICLSTEVVDVPKGSGLGTSSILAAACVKGIFEFFGVPISEERIYGTVLCMEQLMSTGGGWQDQVGGLTPGIKFITSAPGMVQKLNIQRVILNEKAKKELQERFVLIYTGQRRLARNLLRDVMGNYIGGRPESVSVLRDMQRIAALMKFELERGDITAFAKLLNKHWKLSIKLDEGTTNTCINQIIMTCEDMVDGIFIAGAGGGGFLQAILKVGIKKEQMQERIHKIFQNSGAKVWECEILM